MACLIFTFDILAVTINTIKADNYNFLLQIKNVCLLIASESPRENALEYKVHSSQLWFRHMVETFARKFTNRWQILEYANLLYMF